MNKPFHELTHEEQVERERALPHSSVLKEFDRVFLLVGAPFGFDPPYEERICRAVCEKFGLAFKLDPTNRALWNCRFSWDTALMHLVVIGAEMDDLWNANMEYEAFAREHFQDIWGRSRNDEISQRIIAERRRIVKETTDGS